MGEIRFQITPTLWQADRLGDLEPINSTKVPTGMQHDDP